MPTVTFTIASAADDGSEYRDGTSWPPTGAYTTDDGTSSFASNSRDGAGNYRSNVALFRWDTSSIPDNATIVAASFNPWCHNRDDVDASFSLVGDYYDFGGEPSVSADWLFECSPSIFSAVDLTGVSTDVRMFIPLTNLTGINKSGFTGIRCSVNNTSGTPSANSANNVQFKTYENASFHPAELVVEYYVGTGVTFSIASAGDDGSIWRAGTYPPTGSYTADDGTSAYAAKGTNYANVALFRWDTSSIPDGATITEAVFRPRWDACNNPDNYNLVGDYYDFGGEPSVAADWTLECSPSIFDPIDLTVIDTMFGGEQFQIQLTDLTGINTSGYTGIRVSLDGAGVTPTADNSVVFRTYENATFAPTELFVAYTVPDGPNVPIRTGTASEVNASGANSGSTSVTVPVEATAAVAFWSGWDASGGGMTSLALGASSFTIQTEIDAGAVSGSTSTGIATLLTLPGMGSQTFAWNWDDVMGAPDEGGEIVIVWLRGLHPTTPIRDFAIEAEPISGHATGDTADVVIDTTYGDLVIAFGQSYTSGSPVTTGTPFINDVTLNSQRYDATQIMNPGGVSTAVTTSEGSYQSIAAISFQPPDSTTGSGVLLDDGLGETFSGSASLATNLLIPAGSLVVVHAISNFEDVVLTVTDDQSNTYTEQADLTNIQGPGWTTNTAWSILTTDLEIGDEITGTWSGGTYTLMQWAAFSGVDPTPFDQQVQAQDAAFPDSTIVRSGQLTTTYADELLICFNTGNVTSFTPSTGFAEVSDIGGSLGITLQMEYQLVSGISTFGAGPTPSASCYWNSRLLSFKLAEGVAFATVPIATGNDDASGGYTDAAGGWPPSTSGTWFDEPSDPTVGVYKDDKDASGSNAQLVYLRFDTSSIPDGATVIGAGLQLYVTDIEDANNHFLVGDYYDFGGTPSVAADWIEAAEPSIFQDLDLSAIGVGAVNNIALVDLTGINPSGYTGIRLSMDLYTPVFNHDMVVFAAYEHSTLPPAQLTVSYIEAVAEAPVRYFDGSIGEAIAVSGGALGALCNGAYSVVVIAKTVVPNGGNQNRAFLGIQVAATNLLGSFCTYNSANPGGFRVFTDSEESQDSGMNLDDSWQILGYSKASGTTAVRFHRKELGAGSWTHRAAAGTIANNASAVTRVEFGRFMGGAFSSSIDAHIACAALFPTELSDAEFESIQTTPSTQQLLDLGAVGLWDLNQASTATAVTDLTGGGADQTSLTGTTVVTDDAPPGWTFGLEEIWTYLQSNAAATAGPLAFGSNVTLGSLLVVGIESADSSFPYAAPTDTLGNTYQEINQLQTGNGQGIAWWYAVSEAAGANTVTFESLGLIYSGCFVSEYSCDGIPTLDVEDIIVRDPMSIGTDTAVSPSVVASEDNSLVIGLLGTDNGNGSIITAGTNFTLRTDTNLASSAGDDFVTASRELVSAGSTTATFSVATNAHRGAVAIAVFKVAVEEAAIGPFILVPPFIR